EQGEFQSFPGPCSDQTTSDRLEACPAFEVNSLLLEIARRADEWESILAAIGSLDEVPVPVAEVEVAVGSLDEAHRAVLLAADGTSSYRELGDQTMMSLFECARAARDLVQPGYLTRAKDELLMAAAREHLHVGNTQCGHV